MENMAFEIDTRVSDFSNDNSYNRCGSNLFTSAFDDVPQDFLLLKRTDVEVGVVL